MSDDCEFVRNALDGDQTAFAELIARHEGMVRGIIRRFGSDWQREEDDLTQQALLTAYQKLESLGDCSRFESWLWGITSRICWKWGSRRHSRNSTTSEAPEDTPALEQDLSSAERVELRDRIAAAIADLPEEWQPSVLLRYVDGLSYKEVAATLGESEGKVRGHITRGAQRIRERLASTWRDLHPDLRPDDLPDEIDDILEHHPGSVMVIDEDFSILAVNAPYSKQTGFSAAAVTGLRCYDVSHNRPTPCNGDSHPCPIHAAQGGDRQVRVMHVHRTQSGERLEVDITAFPIDETGPRGRARRYWVMLIEPHEPSNAASSAEEHEPAGA